jgi:hypothetical protein
MLIETGIDMHMDIVRRHGRHAADDGGMDGAVTQQAEQRGQIADGMVRQASGMHTDLAGSRPSATRFRNVVKNNAFSVTSSANWQASEAPDGAWT